MGVLLADAPYGLRPGPGAQVNGSHPLAQGLLASFVVESSVVRDGIAGFPLAGVADPCGTVGGLALRFNATAECAVGTWPTSLHVPFPITIDAWFVHIGTPDTVSTIAGVIKSDGTSPYVAYSLYVSNNRYGVTWNNAGVLANLTPATPVVSSYTHQLMHVCASMTTARRALYLNGVEIGTNASAVTTPSYFGAGTQFCFGERNAANPNVAVLASRAWNRALSAAEVSALYAPRTRWEMYSAPNRRVTTAPIFSKARFDDSHQIIGGPM